MKEIKFKVGDKVFCMRHQRFGKITVIHELPIDFPLIVTLGEHDYSYTLEGKFLPCNILRSLFTLEEAASIGIYPEKKKVKKVMYQALIEDTLLAKMIVTFNLFANEDEAKADIRLRGGGYTFVKLLTDRPIEVEVDE